MEFIWFSSSSNPARWWGRGREGCGEEEGGRGREEDEAREKREREKGEEGGLGEGIMGENNVHWCIYLLGEWL